MCRGGPGMLIVSHNDHAFSLHVRAQPLHKRAGRSASTVFPACAGMVQGAEMTISFEHGFPCMCGDGSIGQSMQVARHMFSLHAQG